MKKKIIRISIGAAVFVTALIINNEAWLGFALYLASILIVGGDVIFGAVKNIVKGRVFDENFLMTIAAIGAFCIKLYPEAAAVMLFYQVGELFQSFAVDKSRKSIAGLMNIRPDYANVKRGAELVRVDPNDVLVGDIIVVAPGEKIPLDAVVTVGSSTVDTSALTGESVPKDVFVGAEILSGCININGVITASVTKEFGQSTVSKILDLVENAGGKKSHSENFITKFARVYTPAVVIFAALLAVVPPLIVGWNTFSDWLYRALTFLVVSCPCALVISIPMSFFGGIGGASRKGILIKGGNYLEAMAHAETVVFDKTGTLTRGILKVIKTEAVGITDKELTELAAHAESYSGHPVSAAIKEAYAKKGGSIDNAHVKDAEELAGYGVRAAVKGQTVYVGNAKLMQKIGVTVPDVGQEAAAGIVAYVAVDNRYAGSFVIADEIKSDANKAVSDLRAAGIKKIVMLTGDTENEAQKTAAALGIDEYYAGLLPADKVDKVEELFKGQSKKGKLVFAGDGINDAPVLARADIGVAMGALGSDAAVEAADIVIMNDEPSKIAEAVKISRRTLSIAGQNTVFAIGIKVIVLVLSAFGLAKLWLAVFADVGVAILAVLNAFRALKK
ncbi:MAG: cadmium-translocating P-type ATPase [Clostridiales bacterium]|jgi:Cd2+/Zn2+-exporting ATPase|nr:cadmium-translocating P-type ATPase [Clostridiales bacterium]